MDTPSFLKVFQAKDFFMKTMGQQIAESGRIQTQIQELVAEVSRLQSSLQNVQPANPELASNNKNWLDRAAAVRVAVPPLPRR